MRFPKDPGYYRDEGDPGFPPLKDEDAGRQILRGWIRLLLAGLFGFGLVWLAYLLAR